MRLAKVSSVIPSSKRARAKLVLVVDSDAGQARQASACLVDAGYDVWVASGAEEALATAKATRPDVVLSDVLLGDVDGFALSRMLRAEPALSATPIVLLSAHFGGDADRTLAAAVGANALVERSASFENELEVVRRALAEHGADNSQWSIRPPPSPGISRNVLIDTMNRPRIATTHSDSRYRTLFRGANDAIAILDQDGTFLESNDVWERILQLPSQFTVGKRLSDFSAPGAESANLDLFMRQRDGQGPQVASFPVRRLDGHVLQMELSHSRVESQEGIVLSIGRDVTASLDAARKLEASEAKYRQLLDNIPDAVRTSSLEGRTMFASPNITRISAFSVEELLAADANFWRDRVHPADRGAFDSAREALSLAEELFDLEYRWLRKDGTWVWLHERARVAHREDGPCVEGIIADGTSRRTLEEQMRQAQKMEAIGQLTGGVAHDFNNILAAILANAHFLINDLGEHDPRRIDAEEIKACGERAAALTRQLLAFSRRQVLEPATLDLDAVVTSVEKMLRRLIREDIEFNVVRSDELSMVLADPGQIEQVIVNLVVNARDAMPKGGRLTIETADVTLTEDYSDQQGSIPRGEYVMIAVSDTGCGMDADTKRRAFEPFFTTKDKGRGTGLGLSTCYGIVKQSGGHILVYSEVGVGTTFKVYLPRHDDPMDEPHSGVRVRAASPRSTGGETVLVVEDDDRVRAVVLRILADRGYHVLGAHDGVDAMQVCMRHDGPVHLLLSDVIVPGTNGPELARSLLAVHHQAKVLYMSGYTDHAIANNGALEPGVRFIQKPFSPDALARKVREVIDED